MNVTYLSADQAFTTAALMRSSNRYLRVKRFDVALNAFAGCRVIAE